ncbi:MAG: type II toxin-antitoxin system VapC family toxin [Acidimicrobiia bacterium]|nr:type II toxin-antitoxin system VapC family toxin [Acidimicrobiia bacterium]
MTDAVVLVDTSVAVALVVADHEAHSQTASALSGIALGLAGHAFFETYSVLTRLPQPLRRGPREVLEILSQDFPHNRFLTGERSMDLASRLADLGLAGGSVYDALVGAASVEHGLPLVSRDARAANVYRALGVEFDLIG